MPEPETFSEPVTLDQPEAPALPDLPVLADSAPATPERTAAPTAPMPEPQAPPQPDPAPDTAPPPPPEPEPEPEAEPVEDISPMAVATSRRPAPMPGRPETPPAPPPQRQATPAQTQTQQPAQRNAPQSVASNAQRAAGSGGGAAAGASGGASEATLSPSQRQSAMARWGAQIRSRVERRKTYPRAARRASGTAVVSIRVTPAGQLAGVGLARSSGNSALDQAALQAVQRAGRFPKAPAGITGTQTFSLPLVFSP